MPMKFIFFYGFTSQDQSWLAFFSQNLSLVLSFNLCLCFLGLSPISLFSHKHKFLSLSPIRSPLILPFCFHLAFIFQKNTTSRTLILSFSFLWNVCVFVRASIRIQRQMPKKAALCGCSAVHSSEFLVTTP